VLIFLDVETTGLEQEDKICSIGIIYVEEDSVKSQYELLNEGKKISPKVSSINHITNEMIKNKPKFNECEIYKFLTKHNNKDTTIIGHNVNFDIKKLSSSGFVFKGSVIDTLRVSKHLIEDCESYSLQFLRYELKLYKDELDAALLCGIKGDIVSHHALYDSLLVKLLYSYFLDITSREQMYELSFKNVLIQKFGFGKYEGRYIEEISMCDRGYLEWMLSNIVDLDEDLRYSITYYLQGNQ
jgi:DNA polymerase III epsilon subunit-like protein